jgi:hypothetical protein
MALIKILPEYIENFSLRLHPEIDYVSSSKEPGTSLSTGSMPLSPRPSKCLKNLIEPSQIGQNSFDVNSPGASGFNSGDYVIYEDLNNINDFVRKSKKDGISVNVSSSLEKYMLLVNSSSEISRNSKRFEIVRFDPPFSFTKNSTVKNIIRKVLMPYYYCYYDMCEFGYTNYNTLNFFTGSLVPSSSAIMYPNLKPAGSTRPYSPAGPFSFDFYINPRYTNDRGAHYHAGTIMHVSSSFAVSLISGSLTDQNDTASGFRILLQLSHSADVAPDKINLNIENNSRSWPQDLSFVSSDNSLLKNHWHHVSIRWGTKSTNEGSGSIHIDDNVTYFNIPSSSILPPSDVNCSALVLGNYFKGSGDEARFFNSSAGLYEGVKPYEPSFTEDPSDFVFDNPLNAEIHDVKIIGEYISSQTISRFEKQGVSLSERNLMFYVPPFFVKDTPKRNVLITPFQTENKSTTRPINTTYSFGVGGYMINLPNFVREFVQGEYPRLYNLSSSTIDTTILDITANGHSFGTGSIRKRNLTILPNDNGRFSPNFNLLVSGNINTSMSEFKTVIGSIDLSMISLNEMVTTKSAFPGLPTVSVSDLQKAEDNTADSLPDNTGDNSLVGEIAGVSPGSLGDSGTVTSDVLTVYQRTRDPSSNEVTIFDISNLFYGNRILPESLYLTDPNITGSGGKINMMLRDNGRGGLYRADALTKNAEWANVGTVLYNEGVAVVKSPHIAYFGVEKFEAKFKGEQNVHILTINMPAESGHINSSSNPAYQKLSASFDANEYDGDFVYITGFNLHDDNLNVIMRGNLAQPIKKRVVDEMVVRFKMDF